MTKQFIQNTSDLASWIGTQYPEIRGAKATAIVRTIFGCITKSLFEQQQAGVENPHVQLHGFGSVRLTKMKARKARNPRTGESVNVGERMKLKWNASSTLKDAFNQNDSEFFNKATSFGTNGSDNGEEFENTESPEFLSGSNQRGYNTAGAGFTAPIRETASMGGASESMPKRRPGRPRKSALPPSMEQPVRRSRSRSGVTPESTLGGATTGTPTKRTRKRATPQATSTTSSATTTETGRTKRATTRTRKPKASDVSPESLRAAMEEFFKRLAAGQ